MSNRYDWIILRTTALFLSILIKLSGPGLYVISAFPRVCCKCVVAGLSYDYFKKQILMSELN